MIKVYAVVFSKYEGETVIFLASNFDELVKKARTWSKHKKYGIEIESVNVYGTVDA